MSDRVVNRKGLRCRICTGCGLCPGIVPAGAGNGEDGIGGLHILDRDALLGEKRPFPEGGGRLAVVDLGTTTIAMLLYDRDGSVTDRYVAVNPQTRYGADVLSRIRAAQNVECAKEMRRQVDDVLAHGFRRFQKHLAEGERLQAVLAANTVMTYLLMGWDANELGCAPFNASNLGPGEFFLEDTQVFVMPGMSAFVGGDIVAGVYACGMSEQEELTLLVDLGTNGELVLGNARKRIACATAAGPAFEGGVNKGIWGADMVSFLASLRREGILDETGLLEPDFFEKGVRVGNVLVTQEAVRSIQLAKGALAAGIRILLKRYDISAEQVDRVVLAGGFGYYLNPEDAAEIGLLPQAMTKKAITGGNTALSGALLAGRALLAGEKGEMTQKLQGITEGTEVINLALEPDFQEHYLDSMELNKN